MSLTVKAFLDVEGKENGEIRRFQIPADVSTSYAYLVKKIAGIFPGLKEDSFSLYWQDPDGDSILFSTDEEQMEALGFVTNSVFKVYIRNKEPKAESSTKPGPDEKEELHQGVVCDGCDGSIKGTRFKCLVCPDYDLCSICEGKGVHQEHNMVKYNKPVQGLWGMFSPPPPPMPHGMRAPFMHPGHPRPGEPFSPPPHFRRWMKKFMKRWHNKNAPCQHDDKDDSPDEPEEETTEEEYLKSVGESVSAMLDPMGIDVHFDIEHGGKRHCHGPRGRGKCRGARGQGCRGKSWGPDAMRQSESPKRKEAKKKDKKKEKEEEKCPDAQVYIDVEQPEQSQFSAETSTEEITKETERIVLDDDDDDDEDIDEVTVVKVTHIQPTEPEKMDVQMKKKDQNTTDNGEKAETWTLLSVSSPPAQAPPTATTTDGPTTQAAPQNGPTPHPRKPAPSVQFQMPPQVVYPPSNPHVVEALQQMESMGFNNEGGWLTQLLEAKNGDIIQVLDAIKPQPGRNHRTEGGNMA